MKNILIFPCGSEIALEAHKALRYSTHFKLFGGSSVDDHGKFVFENYIEGIPFVNAPDFLKTVNDIIARYDIDFIIPAHDNVILRLAEAAHEGKLGCGLITSPLETCQIATSKLKTYTFFEGHIPIPRVFSSASEVNARDFPVFLKPEVGNGTRGTQTAKNHEDIAFYMAKDPTLLILEYLPGKEFTVDCFTNKDGQLLYCEGRDRARISNGISMDSFQVKDPRFQKLGKKINSLLTLRGGWFFQVKERADGELVLMEIATRIAGTSGVSRASGVNLPLLSLFDAMDYAVSVFANDGQVVLDRALDNSYRHTITYTHVYLDFDDLVVFNGKVNPYVMAFVFQCLNKGKKIHLLTKHAEDLPSTLKKYRLDNLFDDSIWINKEDDKHSKIIEKDAIFIDDSFAERKKVHDMLRIPTFDAHGIETLMEIF